MRVISCKSDLTVAVERGRTAISLRRGVEYVMHDVEVASGERAGVFKTVRSLPTKPAPWSASDTAAHCSRLVVPFIGGLGDAVSMLPVFAEIRRRNAGVAIEIATTPGPAGVFSMSRLVDRVIEYPLPLRTWMVYDSYVSMEVVHQTAQAPGRPLPEVFASALGLSLSEFRFGLEATADCAAFDVPRSPCVGVAVGDLNSLRTPPIGLLSQLVEGLVRRGAGVVLLGDREDACKVACPPTVLDLRSRTAGAKELAAVLSSMDAVLAHDSFILHLAGALGVPSVGLFTSTSARHAELYSSVCAVQSAMECSPCHAARGGCPRGHHGCIAWNDAQLEANSIVERAMSLLGSSSAASA
jgi:ADP-heptose:LPS heptosyltransferase